jgi:hypothetical protein
VTGGLDWLRRLLRCARLQAIRAQRPTLESGLTASRGAHEERIVAEKVEIR